jgi:hypothetical protein
MLKILFLLCLFFSVGAFSQEKRVLNNNSALPGYSKICAVNHFFWYTRT